MLPETLRLPLPQGTWVRVPCWEGILRVTGHHYTMNNDDIRLVYHAEYEEEGFLYELTIDQRDHETYEDTPTEEECIAWALATMKG